MKIGHIKNVSALFLVACSLQMINHPAHSTTFSGHAPDIQDFCRLQSIHSEEELQEFSYGALITVQWLSTGKDHKTSGCQLQNMDIAHIH